jgi:hypothetical protein
MFDNEIVRFKIESRKRHQKAMDKYHNAMNKIYKRILNKY